MNPENLCLGCMEETSPAPTCDGCGYKKDTAPESLLHLSPGQVLNGKYLLGRVLGHGGFGITYLAYDLTLNLKLAIKEYLPQQLAYRTGEDPAVSFYKSSIAEEFKYGLDRFLEEAQTLARFNEHPNIVSVRDYFEANNTAYLVMNYLEGVTLHSYLESKGGKVPVEQALSIFLPVLDALKEVHAAGILHRDISPDNLLIDKNGRVILIDFGAARQAMGEKSKSLSVIMKVGYSPPEQYQSRGKQGPWTDIYAVAATIYRSITGQAPLEAIDRMAEDDIKTPSQLGVAIKPDVEMILLKAMAIKARNRFQSADEFQKQLFVDFDEHRKTINLAKELVIDKPVGPDRSLSRGTEEDLLKCSSPAQHFASRLSREKTFFKFSKKNIQILIMFFISGLLIYGIIILLNDREKTVDFDGLIMEEARQEIPGLEIDGASLDEDVQQTYDQSIVDGLDADYYIDYENGAIYLGDLPMGSRVVDPSWEWEFRNGKNYSGSGELKPVTWIVVAKDHYEGHEAHVTVITEELIGRYIFDNSTGRGHEFDKHGYNHWGESGTGNATKGLRPWLNSNGIHSDEGFYMAFSNNFQEAIIATTLPNKEWEKGNSYQTSDKVFIPSATEYGMSSHNYTYPIGSAYAFFLGADDDKRVARLGSEALWYSTRSPHSYSGIHVRFVYYDGNFSLNYANGTFDGVRPALNLKSEILVSEIKP